MTINVADQPGHALSHAAAEAYIASTCFKTGPPGRVGVEIEHLVHDILDPHAPVRADRLDQLMANTVLPAGGMLTREPGGQIELSTLPLDNAESAVVAGTTDLDELHRTAGNAGLLLLGEGTDPLRSPRRTLDHPRYAAMESYLDQWGLAGRQMMCSTASVQITVDGGQCDQQIADRWNLVHSLGPTLVAMFANSPFVAGRATGWKSTRQAIWWSIDPARTAPAQTATPCRTATQASEMYARYALNAPVMVIQKNQRDWSAPRGLTFSDWIGGLHRIPELRSPTAGDLAYHLTTLFPPVRARGAFEVRYIDSQPDNDWIVPTVVLSSLLNNPEATDFASEAVEPVAAAWERAARFGLDDPELAQAARRCMELALGSVDAVDATPTIATTVRAFADRHTERNRCPADDRLDRGPSPVQKTIAAQSHQDASVISVADQVARETKR